MADRKGDAALCSLRTVPVILTSEDSQVKVNALHDDASTTSYTNAGRAEKLGLTGHQETVNVSVLNGDTENIECVCSCGSA